MRRANAAEDLTRGGGPDAERVRRFAFGLDVRSNVAFEAAVGSGRDEGEPQVEIDFVSRAAVDRAWSRRGSVSLMERRYPSGRLVLSIHSHPDRGYRVSAPGHGCHIIAADGRRVLSAIPDFPAWRWQRLFFAQVLPLVATLRGFALFHASAVALGSRAFGFVAASGTGKTSVAAHLLAHGASFLTDDVAVLQPGPDRLCLHPGAGMLGVSKRELDVMTASERGRVGRVVGRADKIYLAREPLGRPMPLAGLYYLKRDASVERFSISARAPDVRLLLSSAFIWYLRAPEHLANHLEVCARIAETVTLFDVHIPPGVPAVEVAQRIRTHAISVVPQWMR